MKVNDTALVVIVFVVSFTVFLPLQAVVEQARSEGLEQ